jgi:predicted O-methyltransferase YrrM
MLRNVALKIPAIRRLFDHRNALISERELLIGERDLLLAEREAVRSTRECDILFLQEMRSAQEQGRLFVTEYGYDVRNRKIEQGAGGHNLINQFIRCSENIRKTLMEISRHSGNLARIDRHQKDSVSPFWLNDWFPPFDCAVLYGLVAEKKPRRYIEVGSGISTRFARQAIKDYDLDTRVISIDPHPHNAVDELCDEVICSRMEDLGSDFWGSVGEGDMLFVDNSHRSFPNSDVTVFFTEVLPALGRGTLWGLHDILLPYDYPDEWRGRFYNEQYLLMAYLLGGSARDELVLPVTWASLTPTLSAVLDPLWLVEGLFDGLHYNGSCFWMRRIS